MSHDDHGPDDHDHNDHGQNRPHNDGPKWFYVGLVSAIAIGSVAAYGVNTILGLYFPPDDYFLFGMLEPLAGLIVGFLLGLLIFLPGLRKLNVGQTGYLMWLGDPEPFEGVHLGPSIFWVLPLFMSVQLHSSEAEPVETGDQESATGDGAETQWSAKSTWKIFNLEAFQAGIQEAGTPNFVDGVFVEAMRKSITHLRVRNEGEFSLVNITPTEAAKLASDIARFKTAVKQNGEEIQRLANEKLAAFGIRLGTVQITNVKLSDVVEARLQEIVDETLQSATLGKDVKNKRMVADEFIDHYKAVLGKEDWDSLSPQRKSELVEGSQELAMANEGKADVKSERWRGRQPNGVYTN